MGDPFWGPGDSGDQRIRDDILRAADYLSDAGEMITDTALSKFIGLRRDKLSIYRQRVHWKIADVRSMALERKAARWLEHGRPLQTI